VAAQYDDAITGIDALAGVVTPPARAPWGDHVFHQYVVRVPADTRDELAAHLRAAGVPTMVYFPHPLHLVPAFADLGYREGELPETERACREGLALPMHPHLSEEEVGYVVEQIRGFF
jgi:dTDP-4-amino-4,6-dideoxygalactose transaminase